MIGLWLYTFLDIHVESLDYAARRRSCKLTMYTWSNIVSAPPTNRPTTAGTWLVGGAVRPSFAARRPRKERICFWIVVSRCLIHSFSALVYSQFEYHMSMARAKKMPTMDSLQSGHAVHSNGRRRPKTSWVRSFSRSPSSIPQPNFHQHGCQREPAASFPSLPSSSIALLDSVPLEVTAATVNCIH
jgi:hypothetical protein